MKLVLTILFIFGIFLNIAFCQTIGSNKQILFLVKYKTKRVYELTMDNFINESEFKFELNSFGIEHMFIDKIDADSILTNGKIISSSDVGFLNALVKIYFEEEFIQIWFDVNGNYNYNQNWYSRDCILYNNLFEYFGCSDLISPASIFEETRREIYRKGPFWFNIKD